MEAVQKLMEAVRTTVAPIIATDDAPAPVPVDSQCHLTEECVPPKPPKLNKNATAEQRAAYQEIMQQRRRAQERLREQERAQRDRSSRVRPSKEVETARRAFQRALEAPTLALSAVVTSELPIDHDRHGALQKIIDQAESKLEGCAPCLDHTLAA